MRRRVLFTVSGGIQARWGSLGFDGRQQQPLFAGADVENLNEGDAGDAEEVGGVGGEEAGLDEKRSWD